MTPTRLTAVLLAALLTLAPAADASKYKVIDAVKPLSIDGFNPYTGETGRINICTTSSINNKVDKKKGGNYWLTAAHCISDSKLVYWIGDQKASVAMRDVLNDLAILYTSKSWDTALKLANAWPEFGDRVMMAGHPFGYGAVFFTQGFVANPSAYLKDGYQDHRPFMVLDLAGAAGNSGSPIVDKDEEVISVLQCGWGSSFSPVECGVTFGALRNYKPYFRE